MQNVTGLQSLKNLIFTNTVNLSSATSYCPINSEDGYCRLKKEETISPAILIPSNTIPSLNLVKLHTEVNFNRINLQSIKRYQKYGHFYMFSGLDKNGSAKLVIVFKSKTVAVLDIDFFDFEFFKGPVPCSIAVVTQRYSKNAIKRDRFDQQILPSERDLFVHWFYDGGRSGALLLGEVKNIGEIAGIYKLKHGCLLIITADKRALVYGKNYKKDGQCMVTQLKSNQFGRDLSVSEMIETADIAAKQLILVQYRSVSSGDDDEDKRHFIIFRLNKRGQLFKIVDTGEHVPQKGQNKHFARIIHIREKGDLENPIIGYLIRFITYEGKSVFMHFWKLNKFGKMEKVYHKFKVATLEDSEIEVIGSRKMKRGRVVEIKDGLGFCFLHFYRTKRVIRVVFNFLVLFIQQKTIEKDLTNEVYGTGEIRLSEQLKIMNLNELPGAELDDFIPIVDLEGELVSEDGSDDEREFEYYSNHHKALNDSKMLNPYFTNDEENRVRHSSRIESVRKKSLGLEFDQAEFELKLKNRREGKKLYAQNQKLIENRKKPYRASRFGKKVMIDDEKQKKREKDVCCVLI
jgi:hypothetical protein